VGEMEGEEWEKKCEHEICRFGRFSFQSCRILLSKLTVTFYSINHYNLDH